ncbi:MAG: ABC transporter ATP-binding protein [Candidatus Krumholzibacteria bacterium]|nr:ABC transporter ATP-binding protein [Candidatus Krumholzibacteria bacterium]
MPVERETLRVDAVRKTFRGELGMAPKEVLHGVSFEAHRGEILGFLGPNGTGKTTTIKIILGLMRPDSGCVTIFGKNAGDRMALSRLGYLPENPYFFPHLTLREFLHYCGSLSGIDSDLLGNRCDEMMTLTGLSESADRRLKGFSKGMTQRAGLAQAILHDPDLLILDEPFSGLDPLGRKMVRDIMLDLKKKGKTIFFSSHILPDMEALCDRTVIIRDGMVVRSVSMDEVFRMAGSGTEVIARGCSEDIIEGITDYIDRVASRGRETFLHVKKQEFLRTVIKHLYNNGADVLKVVPDQLSLEEIFIREISGDPREPGMKADHMSAVLPGGKEAHDE